MKFIIASFGKQQSIKYRTSWLQHGKQLNAWNTTRVYYFLESSSCQSYELGSSLILSMHELRTINLTFPERQVDVD
jgi:hypothetical protein